MNPQAGTHLVLAGGGHSHALWLRQWLMQPVPGVQVTLVSDTWLAPYSGMLPGVVAGDYTAGDAHIDLARLCKAAGVAFIAARITGIDAQRQCLHLADRPPLHYDWLSVNTGITPSTLPGSETHALPLKPVSQLLQRWQSLANGTPRHVVMIGAGAAGFEMIIAIRDALHLHSPETRYTLVGAGPLLPGHAAGVTQRARRALQRAGITLQEHCRVQSITADGLITQDTAPIKADAVVLATPGQAPQWLRDSGLALTDDGFIAITDTLQSTSHRNVFAAGDVAVQVNHRRPRAGVFAVRQAQPLFHNLCAALQQRPLRKHRPQRQFLSLLRSGPGTAIASRGRFHGEGGWVWRWKDRIDRCFMAQFENAAMEPAMGTANTAMRCGGCGAKLGKSLLERVLRELAPAQQADTVIGLDHPDDAAVITPPPGQQLVQSVDGFRAFIDDAYLFGRIATEHAVSDLYAMGATPHSALAFVTVPFGSTAVMEDTLRQLMAGILNALQESGMQLVGGHSAEGAELSVSITANGFIEPGQCLTKAGMQDGDTLVLSKPLGTGTVMAAHMQGRAHGEWVAGTLDSMLVSNAAAAERLRARGARAVTDVTGFGLAGHLLELCDASGMGATLDLAALPALNGALACLQDGIESTLAPQNREQACRIDHASAWQDDPRFALLFDPQTAGGLLAALPAGSDTDGFHVIGTVRAGTGIDLIPPPRS